LDRKLQAAGKKDLGITFFGKFVRGLSYPGEYNRLIMKTSGAVSSYRSGNSDQVTVGFLPPHDGAVTALTIAMVFQKRKAATKSGEKDSFDRADCAVSHILASSPSQGEIAMICKK
jgi:hypothetical protein